MNNLVCLCSLSAADDYLLADISNPESLMNSPHWSPGVVRSVLIDGNNYSLQMIGKEYV